MLVDPSTSDAGTAVTNAIRQASEATGASFNYLLATAKIESGLNSLASAATSSARGLFQFVEQSWLATMKIAGPALGYGQYASAITKNASGTYQVADSSLRQEILNLRNDPNANAALAGAFTQANAAVLSERLGRPPTDGELYLAHFLGAGGAARLITLAASNPNGKAADFFGTAAQANPSIFYSRSTGGARSLAQVRDLLTSRFTVARGAAGQGSQASQASQASSNGQAGQNGQTRQSTTTTAAAAPDTAGITNVFAAAMPAQSAAVTAANVRSLFTDGNSRTAGVSSVVSALWSVPNQSQKGSMTQANSAAPGGQTVPGGLLNLFRDPA
jgi:hypothetical protein